MPDDGLMEQLKAYLGHVTQPVELAARLGRPVARTVGPAARHRGTVGPDHRGAPRRPAHAVLRQPPPSVILSPLWSRTSTGCFQGRRCRPPDSDERCIPRGRATLIASHPVSAFDLNPHWRRRKAQDASAAQAWAEACQSAFRSGWNPLAIVLPSTQKYKPPWHVTTIVRIILLYFSILSQRDRRAPWTQTIGRLPAHVR